MSSHSPQPVCARRILVSGRVQGVAFRAATEARARALGLAGFVRNLRDGRVEVVAQGEAAQVAALESWCRRGPPLARVDALEASDRALDDSLRDFAVAPTSAG